MIRLDHARKTVRLPDDSELRILNDASISVEPGETVAVVGPSGSGKSTLLHLLGLLDSPDAGTYEIDGIDGLRLSDGAASRFRGETFGFIFQQFFLLEHRSALQNILAPLQHASWREYREGRRRAWDLLEAVGLRDRAESMPSRLSGGEQQRVAIARALVRRPRYILADEPTGSLDQGTGSLILDILMQTAAARPSPGLLVVTHDYAVASRCQRRLLLQDATIKEMP
jgi:putative ABC transport system ATP-binding protein